MSRFYKGSLWDTDDPKTVHQYAYSTKTHRLLYILCEGQYKLTNFRLENEGDSVDIACDIQIIENANQLDSKKITEIFMEVRDFLFKKKNYSIDLSTAIPTPPPAALADTEEEAPSAKSSSKKAPPKKAEADPKKAEAEKLKSDVLALLETVTKLKTYLANRKQCKQNFKDDADQEKKTAELDSLQKKLNMLSEKAEKLDAKLTEKLNEAKCAVTQTRNLIADLLPAKKVAAAVSPTPVENETTVVTHSDEPKKTTSEKTTPESTSKQNRTDYHSIFCSRAPHRVLTKNQLKEQLRKDFPIAAALGKIK